MVLLVLAMVYGREAMSIKAQFDEGLVGPAFLPLLLTAIVVIGLLGILFRQWRQSSSVNGGHGEASQEQAVLKEHRKPACVMLAVLAYTLFFKTLGYVLATLLLVFALLALFGQEGESRTRRSILAAGMTLIFYVLFSVCFSVRLPLLPGAFS